MSDKTEHPPVPDAFANLGLKGNVLKGLAHLKFTVPSDIQSLLIPRALKGVDLLGQARTGTGKTAAFGLPILSMAQQGVGSQALIMVPTRELAVQVQGEIERLGKFTGLRCVSVVGGAKIAMQARAIEHNVEIVVGTPGRVMDLLDRGILRLDNIRFVVLDEVDRMLDIGFREDIRKILTRLKGLSHVQGGQPGDQKADSNSRGHQTVFVSATISDEIEKLARRYMREPVEKLIAPGANERPTVDKIEQYYLSVEPYDKYKLLRLLLAQEKPEMAIVFTRTKHGAEKLAKNLSLDGLSCEEIHGNLRQARRDRVMKALRGNKLDVLVATDLASRGIDVNGITHIINFDIPEDPEAYVHRIGRTARMGAKGRAFTFVTREQGYELTRVENLINMEIEQMKVPGFEPRESRPDFVPNRGGQGGSGQGGGGNQGQQNRPSGNRPSHNHSAGGNNAPRPQNSGGQGAGQGNGGMGNGGQGNGGQGNGGMGGNRPVTIGSKIRRKRRR